jgi:hypothetical protein
MSTTYQIEIVFRQEFLYDCFAETVADSPLVVLPIQSRVAGITPEEIVQKTIIWYVRRSRYAPNVVHAGEGRRETAMYTEDLACDKGCYRKAVEHIHECLPDLQVTSPFTFVVEAIHYAGRT